MFKVKQKITKILVACLTALFAVVLAVGGIFAMPNTTVNAADPTEITFNLGANGSATHSDGTSETTFSETADGYALNITAGSNMYTGAYDAIGNSCIKLGASSKAGSFEFTVPADVTSVIIAVGKYKANTTKINVNGTAYTLTKNSNDGAYDEIPVDTTSTKSVSLTTVSGGYRAMVNTITFVIPASEGACEHVNTYSSNDDGTHNIVCIECNDTIEENVACTYGDDNICDFCEYAASTYTVTFNVPTGITEVADETAIANSTINLPTTTAPDGYVFAGWSEEKITEATTTKPTLYTDTYTVTEETTLYAVYHNDVEEGGWNLVTDANELATDDIVTIVCPTKNVAIGAQSGTYFKSVNFSSEAPSDEVLKLTLTKNSNGTYSFYTGTHYLAYTGSGNALHTNTSIGTNSSWNLTISGNNTTILNAQYTTRNLQYNASSPRFACYTSSQTAVCLYKYTEGGEISYTSVFCDHSGEKTIVTEDATCTQDGSTTVTCNECGMEISHETITATGHVNKTTTTVDATCTENGSITVTCDDCGETISTETIDATGHSLDEGVITTEPQAGVEGVKTYTCQNGCGYTETESIPALDATKYTLSYSVSGGVDAPASVELANNESTVLPSVDAPANFVFVGWVTEECKETQSAPETIYEANSEYILSVEENVTLYALFTYSTGSGNFVKVTEAPADWSGEYLIVYEDGNVAFNSNLEVLDDTSNTVNVTIENDVIGYNDVLNNAVFTIALIDGSNYSIKATSGKYIGRSSYSNGLDSGNTAVSNTLSIDADGNAVITAAGNTTLRFNKASNQMRFRYYKSGQEAIALYALDSKTYYATDLSVKIESATITIGTDLKVNYYVSMPAEYENATMSFTVNGADGFNYVTEGTKVGEYYVFTVKVGPHQMAENISATLYFGETVLAAMENYSIKTYAQNKLNDPASSDALKQLLTDLLVYGDAAYNYKYETTGETPATSGVANIGTASTATPNNEVDNKFELSTNVEAGSYPVYFKSVTVWFGDTNKIRAALVLTEGVDASKITVTINGVDATVSGNYVYTDSILATGFDTIYTFVLSYDGVVMQTLTYSVNSYAYKMKANAEMSELALALYRYGVSAKAYIG